MSWYDGLLSARRYLESINLTQHALCGVELRCPKPHTMNGFIEFNREYRALLNKWAIPVAGENPVARTNVAPVVAPPGETMLFGFSYAKPSETDATTFVIAGGGELPTRKLDEQRIVRLGEVTPEAMLDKARCVVDIMRTRLKGLGAVDEQLTIIDVYTAHDLRAPLAEVLIPGLPRCGGSRHPLVLRPPADCQHRVRNGHARRPPGIGP